MQIHTLLALALLATPTIAQSHKPSALGLPDEQEFRAHFRDLSAAVLAGDLSPFEGPLVKKDNYGTEHFAVSRSLGRSLPSFFDSEGWQRFESGRVMHTRYGLTAVFPIVGIDDPSAEDMAGLEATFEELSTWVREEGFEGWDFVESDSKPDDSRTRMLTARSAPHELAPRIELALTDIDGQVAGQQRRRSNVTLFGRVSRLSGGIPLEDIRGWAEANIGGAGTKALVAWVDERGLGPNASLIELGGRPMGDAGKAGGNEMFQRVGSLAWRKSTQLVFQDDGRLVIGYYPTGSAPKAESSEPVCPGFPGEARFRRVVRSLFDNAFVDYEPLEGQSLGGGSSAPVEPLGERLPRKGKDPVEEAQRVHGVITRVYSGVDQADLPILEETGVNRYRLQQIEAGFDELVRWLEEEAGNWLITDSTSEDTQQLTRTIELRTRAKTENTWSETISLSRVEDFSTSEEGAQLAHVQVGILAYCSKMLTGLTRSGLVRYQEVGGGFPAANALATWMDEMGFPPEAEIVRIGDVDITRALRHERQEMLFELPADGVTRLAVNHLGRLEFYDFVGDRVTMPELTELHERFVDGRLSGVEYFALLQKAPWTSLEDFAMRLQQERGPDLGKLLAGPLGPDGRVGLVAGPLGPGLEGLQWARLDGNHLAFEFVLGRSKLQAETESPLFQKLRSIVREAMPGLSELGAEIELRQDAWGTRDLSLAGALGDDRREQVILAIRVPAPELAQDLRAELATQFEAIGEPKAYGWAKLRHRDTGMVYEGVISGGIPDGPGRLQNPETGRLVVAHVFGLEPSGPAIFFDPVGEKLVRGRFSDGRLLDRVELPAWKGHGGAAPFHGLDGLELGPFVLARESLAALGKTGTRDLTIPGVGTYSGQFYAGLASGRGVLTRLDGRIQELECRAGIPALVRTLAWPDEERRAYRQRLGSELFPSGDCIQGNAIDGQAYYLIKHSRKFGDTTYEGGFQNRQMHGEGCIEEDWSRRCGNFTRGKRNGVFTIEHTKGTTAGYSYKVRYVNGEQDPTFTTYVPPPSEPASGQSSSEPVEWVKPPDSSSFPCVTCGGTGVAPYNVFDYDNSTSGFVAGDRHYGSWIFSGYHTENPYGGNKTSINTSGACSQCNGTGSIRY